MVFLAVFIYATVEIAKTKKIAKQVKTTSNNVFNMFISFKPRLIFHLKF